MNDQERHYDEFAEKYADDILACPEPELWTTDYGTRGRIYQEIKERLEHQKKLITKYFSVDLPVLDIGCGFGRQALMLAKENFIVTGIDTGKKFIEIANHLSEKHNYSCAFICGDLLKNLKLHTKFFQFLLLDVLEHIAPKKRRLLFEKIAEQSLPGAVLIISIPKIKMRLRSRLNNSVRKSLTYHFPYFLNREEHPYPIPDEKRIFKLINGIFTVMDQSVSEHTNFYVLKLTR